MEIIYLSISIYFIDIYRLLKIISLFIIFLFYLPIKIKANENNFYFTEIESLIMVMKLEEINEGFNLKQKQYLTNKVDYCKSIVSVKQGYYFKKYLVDICRGQIETL